MNVTDPHGLLESGERLATLTHVVSMLGCSKNALKDLVGGIRGTAYALGHRNASSTNRYTKPDKAAGQVVVEP